MTRSQLTRLLHQAYRQAVASTPQALAEIPSGQTVAASQDPGNWPSPPSRQAPAPLTAIALPPARQASVLVVGAGLAGLVVAHQLRQAGWAAEIIEARDRLGGRILSQSQALGTHITAELGGEAFDSHHHHCLGLAQGLGLSLIDLLTVQAPDLEEVYFFAGQRLGLTTLSQQWRSVGPRMAADLAAVRQFMATAQISDRVLDLDHQSISAYLTALETPPQLQAVIEAAYTAKYGSDTADQSSLNLLGFIAPSRHQFYLFGHSDERYCIAGGNQQLPQRLAQPVLDQVDVDTRLVALALTPAGRYRATVESGGRCCDRLYDYVVLTVPFNVLRTVALTVPLPLRQRQAIDHLGYNSPTKLITRYRQAHWRNHGQSNGLVYTDLPLQHLWETSESMVHHTGPALLTNYTGGSQGRQSTITDLETLTHALVQQGDRIFPGLGQAHEPVGSLRSPWLTDAFSQGAYSCYRPGQWTAFYGQEGQRAGNLFFAGEHCSRQHQGYMEGSAETGMAVAIALLQDLGPREGYSQ